MHLIKQKRTVMPIFSFVFTNEFYTNLLFKLTIFNCLLKLDAVVLLHFLLKSNRHPHFKRVSFVHPLKEKTIYHKSLSRLSNVPDYLNGYKKNDENFTGRLF